MNGRDFVTPDDVKALAHATLSHRLALRPEAELEGVVGQRARHRPRLRAGPPLRFLDRRRGGEWAVPAAAPPRARAGGPPAHLGMIWLWICVAVTLVDLDRRDPTPGSPSSAGPLAPVRRASPTSDHAGRANPSRRTCAAGPGRLAALGGRDAATDTGSGCRAVSGAGSRPTCGRPDVATCSPTGVDGPRFGPLGLGARQRTRRSAGSIRSLPPFDGAQAPPVEAGHACASSTGGRRSGSGGRARSSTRCATTSAATTSARSTGAPPPAAATSSSARGSPSATVAWCSSSTPRGRPPAGSRTCRASTRRWMPRCCWRRWPPVRATGWTSSRATGGSAPGSLGSGRATAAGCRTRWPACNPCCRGRLGRPAPRSSPSAAPRAGRPAHRSRARGDRGGTAAGAPGPHPAPPGRARLGQRPRPRRAAAARRDRIEHVYDAAAAERTIADCDRTTALLGASAWTSSTRRRTSRPRWPTTTSC